MPTKAGIQNPFRNLDSGIAGMTNKRSIELVQDFPSGPGFPVGPEELSPILGKTAPVRMIAKGIA